uniref:Uncharacterized protein n=1 Tax=Glossina austeni TaxID=7395 RepID=A0A1A9V2N6_GLOAU
MSCEMDCFKSLPIIVSDKSTDTGDPVLLSNNTEYKVDFLFVVIMFIAPVGAVVSSSIRMVRDFIVAGVFAVSLTIGLSSNTSSTVVIKMLKSNKGRWLPELTSACVAVSVEVDILVITLAINAGSSIHKLEQYGTPILALIKHISSATNI